MKNSEAFDMQLMMTRKIFKSDLKFWILNESGKNEITGRKKRVKRIKLLFRIKWYCLPVRLYKVCKNLIYEFDSSK